MSIVSPRQNDSVIILGKRGSGKSSLARKLLLTQENVIVIDTKKNEKEWDKVGKKFRGDPWKRGAGRWIWQPQDAWLHDCERRDYDINKIYLVGKRVLYVDELADLGRGGRYPSSLQTISMRGRSANLGLWGTTQRPHKIPLELLSECTYVTSFCLSLKRDRDRAEELFERHLAWESLGQPSEHRFYMKGPDGVIMGPLFLPAEALVI